MQTGQVPAQVLRRHAGIRQHTEAPRAVVEDELQGLARIVWHGVGQDPQIADAEGIVGTAETDGGPVGAAQRCRGAIRAVAGPDRNTVFGGERIGAADMVAMLVRDENGVEGRRRAAQAFKPAHGLADAESAIEQDTRARRSIGGFDEQRIALAAAAETGESHCHRPPGQPDCMMPLTATARRAATGCACRCRRSAPSRRRSAPARSTKRRRP